MYRQEDNTELQHVVATIFEDEDDNVGEVLSHEAIDGLGQAASVPALQNAARLLNIEYGELKDNIADFEMSQGGTLMRKVN